MKFTLKIRYVESEQSSIKGWLFFTIEARHFYVLYIMPHKSWCFRIWLVGTSIFLSLVSSTRYNVSNPFVLLFLASKGFLTHGLISTLLKTVEEFFQTFFISLYEALSSLVFSPENSNQPGLVKISAPPPEFRELSELSFEFFLMLQTGKSRGSKMMMHYSAHLIHLFFLKDHCFCCLIISGLKVDV